MLGYPWHSLVAEPFSESILDWKIIQGGVDVERGIFTGSVSNVNWDEFTIELLSGTQFVVNSGTFTFLPTDNSDYEGLDALGIDTAIEDDSIDAISIDMRQKIFPIL